MENEEVVELLRVRTHARILLWTGSIGGVVICAFTVPAGPVAAACGGGFLMYVAGKELTIKNMEGRIKNLGCSCVL